MTPLRPVSAEEIESLAIGAWILGTGGGGSPYLALLNMRALYRQGAVVSLIDPLDLADDDLVAVVSNMGAPLVGQERLTDPRTIARAVTMMEEYLGRRFRAIMSLEIGGGNAIQPFMAAALLDRPVVDADCMGRAFPEAQAPRARRCRSSRSRTCRSPTCPATRSGSGCASSAISLIEGSPHPQRSDLCGKHPQWYRPLRPRSTDAEGSLLESLVGGQQLQSPEPASRKHERGEMDRVEGTERPDDGDGTGGLADAASDFPQLTSGPDRGNVPLGVNHPLLGSAAESAQPDEGPARLDQREAGRHEHPGRTYAFLDRRRRTRLEHRSQHR